MEKKRKIILFTFMGLISLVLSFLYSSSVDNDLLWHFKLGENILQNGITIKDTFSWQEGLTWISQEWLYDIYIYLLIKNTGLLGFALSMAVLFFIVMLIAFQENKNNIRFIPFFIIFLLIRFLFGENAFNRPSLYSIIFIVLLMKFLMNEKKKKIHYVYVFLIGIIIANIHGGALITCCVIILLFNLLDIVLLLLGNYKNISNIKFDFCSIVLFLLGGLINPYFYRIYEVGLKGPFLESSNYIMEWQPLEVMSAEGLVVVVITLINIIAIANCQGFRKFQRRPFVSLALTCAFFILGLSSLRGIQILSVFITVFNYRYVQSFAYKCIIKFFPDIKNSILLKDKFLHIIVPVICGIGILTFLPQEKIYYSTKYESFEEIVEEQSNYSYKILDYMKNNFDDETRVLNFYNDGNYMILKNIKVFIDSRQHPYSPEFGNNNSLMDLFGAMYSSNYYKEFMKVVEKYDIEYVYWSHCYDLGYDALEDFQNDFDVVIMDKLENQEYNQYLFRRK